MLYRKMLLYTGRLKSVVHISHLRQRKKLMVSISDGIKKTYRTFKENQVCFENKFEIDLNLCLKQIKLLCSLHTCAIMSELP